MGARYIARRGQARHQRDEITVELYYRIDIFTAIMDSQLQELNNRFSENSMELLTFSCALDPTDKCKSFKIDDIYKLFDKFYPQDFTKLEKENLRRQLMHYEVEIATNSDLHKLSTISELSQWLVKTSKSEIYSLIYRLVRLVLKLPVSIATTERAFSAMNIVKTKLRSKMEDEFLTNALVVYIEREITEKFSTDSIIDGFRDMKSRQVPL